MDPENDATNSVADDAVRVDSAPEVETDDQTQPELQGGQDPDEGNQEPTDEDLEEVDFEGHKVRGPKGLKDALLRQADYTRKTQEVAEQRKALEARQAEIVQQAEAQRESIREYAKLEQVEERISKLKADRPEHLKAIAELRDTDWDQWFASNRAAAEADWAKFQAARKAIEDYSVDLAGLENDRDTLKSGLQTKERERISKAEREHVTRLEQAHAELARDLKGDWTPQTAQKLIEFGESQGFSREWLEAQTDPKLIKVFYAAWKGANRQKTEAARAALQAQQAAKPVPQVGGSAPAGKDPTRMSTSEWMRWRDQQSRQARKAR